ncbi:MAG: FKBP-type peptidyl-prolyl cis-trans isomerase [Bacteroidales bacterium]|nr:FKBP-type peptidyl-prolyl cis-trans isomerase [Bacteroidales bacterium]
MKIKSILTISFLILSLASCKEGDVSSDFASTEKGFKFKHCLENKTSPKVKVGDIILGEIEIRQNDSILYSNFGSPNRLFKVNADTVSDFDKLLLNVHIGDSIIIEPPADSIVSHVSKIVTKPGDKIRFYIKVHQIISQKELTEHDKQVIEAQRIEDSTLAVFVAKYFPNAEKKQSGLYILKHNKTQGLKAEYGDTISVYYSVSDTLNNVLDKNTNGKPFEFILGDDGLIAGWTEGLSYMRKGEYMKILIPSKIAYGDAGYGAISPYTPLIFELNLVEVKKQ